MEQQETFEKRMRPAWRSFLTWWILSVAVAALAVFLSVRYTAPWWTVAVALIPVVVIMLKRCSTEFIVKHDEVTMEKGLFAKNSVEIGMPQIRTIEVRQTVFQRMLGIGDIMIASSGTDTYEIIVSGIEQPKELRDVIQGFQRKAASVAE